jgi:hypothetical protein
MPAGRPPKPIEQKRLLGNPGKRAMPDENSVVLLPMVEHAPEPTRPLLKYGQELWDRIWGMGATWVSDKTDIELLMMTCEMIDERWNLRVKVMQSDDAAMRRGCVSLTGRLFRTFRCLGSRLRIVPVWVLLR